MRRNTEKAVLALAAGILFSLVFTSISGSTGALAQQASVANPPTISGFNDHINQYMKLHQEAVKKVPKAGAKSKPDKIEVYQEGLADLIRASRGNAKVGEIFTTDIASQFRTIIRTEFKGKGLTDLKSNAKGAQVQGVPLRVNYPYPDTTELVDTPPTLLLKLPELPKELGYHFAGRRLLLIDREARIIVDYIPDALP